MAKFGFVILCGFTVIDMGMASSWFVGGGKRLKARIQLFCFPYAGGGAAIYRQWGAGLGQDVELIPVELPGRGGRMKEPAFNDLRALIRALSQALPSRVNGDFAFFGHSMGALIAFELARELRRMGHRQPKRIFVSGRRAPQMPDDDPFTYDLPEPEFKRELYKLNGTPKEVLEHEELMTLMIPLLRADFQLIQTYVYKAEAPLSCPISVYGGFEDHEVPRDRLLPWKEQTDSAFSLHMLPGDHFFLKSARPELLALISADLRPSWGH